MKYYLTIDIGGTDMKYGVINSDEILVFKGLTPTNAHLGGSNIIKQIKNLFNELSNDYKLDGIAISSTGGIDESTQMLTPSTSVIDYPKVNFRRDLAELNVNVSAENDVNSMGLCEFSLVDDVDNMKSVIALTIGTGIGGALLVNHEIHRGNAFTAGEIGKMRIYGDTTFEELASTSALVKFSSQVHSDIENGLDVYRYYDNGDEEIKRVVSEFYNNLSIGIANLIYILNPDHIIIGGGVSNRGNKFLDELTTVLKPKLWSYLQDSFTISIAKTKNDAGMIGAFKKFKQEFNL